MYEKKVQKCMALIYLRNIGYPVIKIVVSQSIF